MHGLLRCNMNAGVHASARRAGRVTQRCHNSPEMGNGASKCEWRHTAEARGGFGEIWRKLGELRLDTGWEGLTFAEALGRCHTRWGCRWKSQNRKIVPLSPYVEKPLNSKVIKDFVPELRSRKCFSCFEIPMFYIYKHYISISHIAVSGYGINVLE